MPSKHSHPHLTGNDKGLYATMIGGRIDPSSCLDTCWVDDMAVWWFRATCFHGLKYLCVNREVLKQNFIMRTEMKASSECLYRFTSEITPEVFEEGKKRVELLVSQQQLQFAN